jgi:hypothetical protein
MFAICRTWKDEGSASLCLKEIFGVLQNILEEGSKPGISMVLSRNIHSVAHALMDINRPCKCRVSSPAAAWKFMAERLTSQNGWL